MSLLIRHWVKRSYILGVWSNFCQRTQKFWVRFDFEESKMWMFFIQFLDHIIIVKIGDRIVKFGTHDCLFLIPIPNIILKYLDLGRFGQGQKFLGPAENDYSCLTSIIIRGTCESCNCNGALASFSKNPILVSLNVLKNEFQNCANS